MSFFSNSPLAGLINAAGRAKAETFDLVADAWNKALEAYRVARPIVIRSDYRGDWRHPWQVSPRWDAASGKWLATINPGFVNGLDAEARVAREGAPEETLKRVGEGAGDVFARLTEEPEIEIPLELLRAIGPDATPTGTVGDPSSARAVFEPVPKFFETLGVGDPPEMTLNASEGIKLSASFLNQEALNERRLLRALDITLTKDRSAVAVQWSAPPALLEGGIAQLDLTYSTPPSSNSRARIGFIRKFSDDPPPSSSEILLGSASDNAFDRLHLATLYFLSPPGAPESATVGADWRPFLKHRVFWNLNYSTNRLPVAPPPSRVTFPFPLAGGVATSLINSYLALQNETFNTALKLLRGGSLEGRFWTT